MGGGAIHQPHTEGGPQPHTKSQCSHWARSHGQPLGQNQDRRVATPTAGSRELILRTSLNYGLGTQPPPAPFADSQNLPGCLGFTQSPRLWGLGQ